MAIARPRLTLEEFLRLPEDKPALEFAEGVVTQKVSPKTKHSRLQLTLAQTLDVAGVPNKLAMAFTELRATFAGRSVVPDVSVFRWSRIPRTPEGTFQDDVLTPPDVAVEITSPEQSANALVRRCLWYVSNGVEIAVLIDPEDETVLVFRRDAVPLPVAGDEAIDLREVLPDLRLTAQELFAALRPD
jgi:Uma2 family endonuclease